MAARTFPMVKVPRDMGQFAHLKQIMGPFLAGLDLGDPQSGAFGAVFAPEAMIRMSHPIGTLQGPKALQEKGFAPLLQAFPDVERRNLILVAGQDEAGAEWVGCAGHYLGTFVAPFHDVPPTGHVAHMRFHEFYRIEAGRIIEMQAIWDLPELMMQAGAWPMAPSLGRELFVPGPMTQDGLDPDRDGTNTEASKAVVIDMLTQLSRHPSEGGPEIMRAEEFWHPKMNWYGPAGIGTARGIAGFRNWHQIPFLNALPDRRGGTSGDLPSSFFAEGDYVAVTGWPNMQMTATGDGWMGIAPSGQPLTMRSLDFWRVDGGKIRENWVLVDLLDVYRQLGVDVLARMREFNKARVPGSVPFPVGAP